MSSAFGGSKSSSSSKPVDMTPPEIEALRGQWAGTLGSIYSQGGRPAYPGPFVEPITAQETQNLGEINTAANDPTRQGYIQSVLQGQYLPGQQNSNPFLQKAVQEAQRTNLQGLEETLTRSLPGRFTQGGHFSQPTGSSAFDRAAAIATRGVADANAGIATNMYNQQFQQERTNQQQAVQLGQQDVQTLINNLQAQGLPRLINDLGIERALQEFQGRSASLLQALQIATGAPLTSIAQESQSKSTTSPNIIGTLFPKGV